MLPVIPLDSGGVATWPQLKHAEGWRQVNEGRDGTIKYGLVAAQGVSPASNSSGSLPVLVFDVTTTAAAQMLVGYLRSYENMGVASIAVDGKWTLSVDGMWSSRTSQYCSELILLPSAGTHTVTVTLIAAEDRGLNKFKILDIVVY